MTVIETKNRKVTIMSAKPSTLPQNLALTPLTTKVNKPVSSGPTYSDAFAMFLQGASKTAEPTTIGAVRQTPPKPPVAPAITIPVKVIIQPASSQSKTVTLSQPTTLQTLPLKPDHVTPAQKKQEAWTNKVLEQTQMKNVQPQRVKTERIHPYVSGQNPLYTSQVRSDNQQLFYTIQTSPAISSSSSQLQVKIEKKEKV